MRVVEALDSHTLEAHSAGARADPLGTPPGVDRRGAGPERVGVRFLERRAHTWHGSGMPVGRLQEVVIIALDRVRRAVADQGLQEGDDLGVEQAVGS